MSSILRGQRHRASSDPVIRTEPVDRFRLTRRAAPVLRFREAKAAVKIGERRMNTRTLKKHLKYIVPEMRLALIKEPGANPLPVNAPDDLEKFVEPLRHYSEEYFLAFHLTARNEICNYQIISHGSLSASLVHPREVFKGALIANSHSIIIAHNHPGGSLTPSREDLETTETLIKAGDLLGVKVIDHIIVSSNGLCSLRETHGYIWS